MHAPRTDPSRVPVVVAAGQTIERTDLVTQIDLMARAADEAFALAPALRDRIDRLTVVDIVSHTGPSPAGELAERLGVGTPACEVTTVGGNTPQWLVNRAAADVAAGRLGATLIAGAEAIRSSKARRAAGIDRVPVGEGRPPDAVVGVDVPPVGPAELAVGLLAPVHLYAMFESVVAARAGRTSAEHREAMARFLAPFTQVAAANPMAWFPEALDPGTIATPTPDNRIVAEPYTKRMAAFLGSDQGAVLLVCSLAEAERAGVADRAVFVWSGATAMDVRAPVARLDPGTSPAMAAAGRALFEAASAVGGRAVDLGDVSVLDVYSCFPSAVELAAAALDLDLLDPRGLTSTGGLPYFGGPGNNYTTHGIGAVTDRLRDADPGGGTGALGLATGLGWYVTKHSFGLYGTEPPPGGFRMGDTTAAQEAVDADEQPVALEVDGETPATVVAATVIRDGDGTPTGAPVFARLADGRRMALTPADDAELAAVGATDVAGLVGSDLVVLPGGPRYRLAGR